MERFDAEVHVWLKPSVFDPQGNAVEQALQGLGHTGVENVRIGKSMNLQVEADNENAANSKVKDICEKVLCNLVIETYDFTLRPEGQSGAEEKEQG